MRSKRLWRLIAMLALLTVVAAACNGNDDEGAQDDDQREIELSGEGDTLETVIDRGILECGINGTVPGFSITDEEGNFTGFDIDYCRAVAAAVLGDSEAVNYTELTAEQRFTALQAGEIDVLIRNTTWTSSRDGGEGATFATTTFYDGQGMMVNADSGVTDLEGLEGATICVLKGTTTELNLATVFEARGIAFEPLTLDTNEDIQPRFTAGECEGWTSDKSQLAGIRSAWPESEGGPESLTILDETMSKEPLGPVTRDGDSEWAQVVDWVVIATIQAEEFGITSDTLDDFLGTEDPEIGRLLGLEGEEGVFDPGLGFPEPTWAQDVISQVGNYAEIYDRNVGPDTPLGLERGFNNLWTEGGLLYPPPYR